MSAMGKHLAVSLVRDRYRCSGEFVRFGNWDREMEKRVCVGCGCERNLHSMMIPPVDVKNKGLNRVDYLSCKDCYWDWIMGGVKLDGWPEVEIVEEVGISESESNVVR